MSEYLLASTFTKSSHNRGQHGFSRRFIPAGVHYCSRTHSATTYRSGWLTRPKPDIQLVLGATRSQPRSRILSASVQNSRRTQHPGNNRPRPICIIIIIINHGGATHSCVGANGTPELSVALRTSCRSDLGRGGFHTTSRMRLARSSWIRGQDPFPN